MQLAGRDAPPFYKECKMSDTRQMIMLAKVISQQHGVNVKFSDTGTACCGQNSKGSYTITLPVVEGDNVDMLYRGYIDHEVGHVRFTTFKGSNFSNSAERKLANVFEDEFVERKMGDLFPGSKTNLRNLARYIFNEEHLRNGLDSSAASRLFTFALYHRRAMLDPELGKFNDMIDQSLLDMGVSKEDLAAMLSLVNQPSSSTSDNNQIAHALYGLMKFYMSRDISDTPSHEKPEESGGEQGQDNQDEQGADDEQDAQDGNGDSMSQQREQLDLDDFSISNRINRELEHLAADYKPDPDSQEQWLANWLADASAMLEMPESRMPDYEATYYRVVTKPIKLDEQLLSALRKRLPSLLQSSRIRPCAIGTRGKIYGKRIARAAVLDNRIFHTPMRKLEQELEVGILCDYSGSMQGDSATLDRAVYAALVMLKELPRVKAFAYGFTGDCYRKLCDINARRVREFRGLTPTGGTPLAPSLFNIASVFNKTGRRILFVATDGQPNGGIERNKPVISLLEKMGLEVYGIGIGCGAAYLPELFGEDKQIVVESISEFPAALEMMLRKAMLCAA